MADDTPAKAQEASQKVIDILMPLNDEARQRAYISAGAIFGYAEAGALPAPSSAPASPAPAAAKSSRAKKPRAAATAPAPTPTPASGASSPKEFLAQKTPKTDVERVACFAYYLAHHRSTQRFKTSDINALNKEAGRPNFANAASAVNNAARAGFLDTASRGLKRLSARGEKYVDTLPDQAAAKDQMRKSKARRGRPKADAAASKD